MHVLIEKFYTRVIMKGDYGGMGMLKSISLENYKCFKRLDDFEIAPLTVLCGVNSSGKSSILKSLLMLKQSFESNYDKNSLLFNGNYTTNGSYNDVVFSHKASNKICFSNEFIIENSNFVPAFEKSTLDDLAHVLLIETNHIKQLDVIFTLELRNKISSKYVHDNTIYSYCIEYNVTLAGSRTLCNKIRLISQNNGKYDVQIIIDSPAMNEQYTGCSCFFQGLVLSKIIFGQNDRRIKNEILSLVYSLAKIVAYQYKGVKYIAPIRKEPNRVYEILQDENDVGLYGESTPQVLYSHKEDTISCVNPPENEKFFTKRSKGKYIDQLNVWCDYLGMEPINFPEKNNCDDVINLNVGLSNYADVGFGVSQILPIIATGLLMKNHETLVLQQPEIHLHPKMQMNFADFLLATAYTGKNIIIETHSDHIINRLLRRIMEDKRFQSRVKFYFIDKNKEKAEEIKVDPVRGFINAPDDFFSQFGSESEAIFNASIRNTQKIRLG